jgi:hypothetical protein
MSRKPSPLPPLLLPPPDIFLSGVYLRAGVCLSVEGESTREDHPLVRLGMLAHRMFFPEQPIELVLGIKSK